MTASTARYPLRGQVVNSLNGQPIARALVILNQEDATLTGADGEFAFDQAPGGWVLLSIQKPGYAGFGNGGGMHSSGFGGSHNGPPRSVDVGPDTPPLSFSMLPLATISGTVTLSTADSPDGIAVMIYRRQVQNGRTRWTIAGQSKTRSDGSFRLADLEPGSYLAYTEASMDRPTEATANRQPIWGFPSVYYPGVADIAGAGVLALRAGQQTEADFTLTRQRFFPVTAVVRGDLGAPTNFEILDSAGRQSGLAAQFDPRDQRVHASVPNGSWSLVARAFGRNMLWGRTNFQVSGAPVSFAISVSPVPKIPIEIRYDLTAASGEAQGSFTAPGVGLSIEPADEFSSGGFGNMQPVKGSGDPPAYEMEVYEPGRYWVDGSGFAPLYINSISSGGVDLASTPLTVFPGSTPATIEVTLRNDSGSIAGRVRGDQTAATGATAGGGILPGPTSHGPLRIWIYAIPLFPLVAEIPQIAMSSAGQFTMPNLAPGAYRVVACYAPQEIDFHSQEGLAAWAGKGQVVTVEPGGTASAELDVLHVEAAP